MIAFGLAILLILFYSLMVVGWDMHERGSLAWSDAISFVGLCGMLVVGSLFFSEVSLR